MRRGVGLKSLQRKKEAREKFAEVGSDLADMQIETMTHLMNEFKSNLEQFAQKHRKDIRKDPLFRVHFQKMCNKIGVDPLASNKGFWGQLLGVGDFYYELGVKIIEVCLTSRSTNGGLIELVELQKKLKKARGTSAEDISVEDIETAIKKLKVLGSGFDIFKVGDHKVVQSVPVELNMDHAAILTLADRQSGSLSVQDVQQELGWTPARTETVISQLLREGMCWIDLQAPDVILYWFPGLVPLLT
eukprot:Sdes_comp10307_c0_seq1m1945